MIEFGDGGDARLAGNQVGPAFGNRVSDRRHKAKPSDNDATTAHYDFLRVRDAGSGTHVAALRNRQVYPASQVHAAQALILRLRTDESHRKQQGATGTVRPPAFCGSEFRYDWLRP
ncbi:hypothetical protein GCM10027081_33850 [Cupriavidus yeoncheonensis]